MKLKGEYAKVLNRLERKKDRLLRENEKEVKQFVKQRALSVGIDLMNTQLILSSGLMPEEELKRKRFQSFDLFLCRLADNHHIEFYFEIKNGKFTWL